MPKTSVRDAALTQCCNGRAGWRMLEEECPISQACPLMQEKSTGRKYSCGLPPPPPPPPAADAGSHTAPPHRSVHTRATYRPSAHAPQPSGNSWTSLNRRPLPPLVSNDAIYARAWRAGGSGAGWGLVLGQLDCTKTAAGCCLRSCRNRRSRFG